MPSHVLPPGQTRARNRARRRRNVLPAILVGPPAVTVVAIVGNGRQEHAGAIYYLIGVPVIVVLTAPVAVFIRLAIEHDRAHTLNEGGWAPMAGGLLATYGLLGGLLMLRRAVAPGRRRRAFWLFPPQWLDHELEAGVHVRHR